MRQISIKNLYKNLSKEFEDLPFEVTKHGKTVAYVSKSLDNVLNGLDKKGEKTATEVKSLDNVLKGLDKKGSDCVHKPKTTITPINSIIEKFQKNDRGWRDKYKNAYTKEQQVNKVKSK